jgi:hypothetical protein
LGTGHSGFLCKGSGSASCRSLLHSRAISCRNTYN